MIDLQQSMQTQLDVQAARSRAQRNLGSMVQYPAAGATLTGQPGLSANAPAFVPGQGLPGIGTTFYSSMPCVGDHAQQMGSVSRSTETKLTQ